MGARLRICAVVIALAASSPAHAINNDDIAGLMGLLWRLQDQMCPSISFDPATLVKTMTPLGMTPDAVRRKYRAAFNRGYAVASDWLSQLSVAEFCKVVEQLADGKHDIFGNLKDVPVSPFPGVTIRH